eukprot:SAG31_NODE_1343_length_8700_cov_1.967911_6_plen_157_part_00
MASIFAMALDLQRAEGSIQQATAVKLCHVVRIATIVLLLIASGASSGLSFYATGQVMAGYPTFLLYFCNGCYAVGYFVLLLINALVVKCTRSVDDANAHGYAAPLLAGTKRSSSLLWGNKREQVYFAAIGICTGLSLEMQQFSNGKVDGQLRTYWQ